MSPFLSLLAIDWVMKTYTAQKQNDIQWTSWTQLDYLGLCGPLRPLLLQPTANAIELWRKIEKDRYEHPPGKSKVLRVYAASTTPIKLEGRRLKRWKASPILAVSSKSNE